MTLTIFYANKLSILCKNAPLSALKLREIRSKVRFFTLLTNHLKNSQLCSTNGSLFLEEMINSKSVFKMLISSCN